MPASPRVPPWVILPSSGGTRSARPTPHSFPQQRLFGVSVDRACGVSTPFRGVFRGSQAVQRQGRSPSRCTRSASSRRRTLPPVDERLRAIEEAGYNTFLLRTRDVFIDMLTDSGTNAMSDNQLAAMMVSDDAYAGGESYYKLLDAVKDVLGFEYCVPAHQGRAAEHLLAKIFVKPGDVVPMNYHFTTTKAHFEMAGGKVLEIYGDEALETDKHQSLQGQPRHRQVPGR